MLMGVLGGGGGERKREVSGSWRKKTWATEKEVSDSRLERMSRQKVWLSAAPGQGISFIRGNIVIALFNSPWGKKWLVHWTMRTKLWSCTCRQQFLAKVEIPPPPPPPPPFLVFYCSNYAKWKSHMHSRVTMWHFQNDLFFNRATKKLIVNVL